MKFGRIVSWSTIIKAIRLLTKILPSSINEKVLDKIKWFLTDDRHDVSFMWVVQVFGKFMHPKTKAFIHSSSLIFILRKMGKVCFGKQRLRTGMRRQYYKRDLVLEQSYVWQRILDGMLLQFISYWTEY
jgi:hypothetical protein